MSVATTPTTAEAPALDERDLEPRTPMKRLGSTRKLAAFSSMFIFLYLNCSIMLYCVFFYEITKARASVHLIVTHNNTVQHTTCLALPRAHENEDVICPCPEIALAICPLKPERRSAYTQLLGGRMNGSAVVQSIIIYNILTFNK